jgi:hypothetical protein
MTTIHDPRLLPFSFSRNFGLLAQAGVGGDGTDVWVSSATKSSATGELPVMLNRAAQMQEQDLERRALTIASLLEPVLILTMGVVVLLIVLAVLMPIIEINQLVK